MAKTVLAVDDSASIRQMVSFTLKSAGYDVVEAVDGMDGLEKAKTKSINLVLTDQNMPRLDGLTLIKNLRGMPQYAKTPILMLTTESSDAMKAQPRHACPRHAHHGVKRKVWRVRRCQGGFVLGWVQLISRG